MSADQATHSVKYDFVGVGRADSATATITVQATPHDYPNENGNGNEYLGFAVVHGVITTSANVSYSIPDHTPYEKHQVLWENKDTPEGGSKDGIQVLHIVPSDNSGWGAFQYDAQSHEFILSFGGSSLKFKLTESSWPPR